MVVPKTLYAHRSQKGFLRVVGVKHTILVRGARGRFWNHRSIFCVTILAIDRCGLNRTLFRQDGK